MQRILVVSDGSEARFRSSRSRSWPLARAEHAEQLAIQVIAFCDDHNGGVLYDRFLYHPGGKAGHGNAFATALGLPHTTPPLPRSGLRARRRGASEIQGPWHQVHLRCQLAWMKKARRSEPVSQLIVLTINSCFHDLSLVQSICVYRHRNPDVPALCDCLKRS